MNSSSSLYLLYQRWHQIASSERMAIQQKAWGELEAHAEQKAKIMEEIRQTEAREGIEKTPDDRLRLIIHQVADLEQQNSEWIAREKGQLEVQMKDLQRRRRILHKIRKSY